MPMDRRRRRGTTGAAAPAPRAHAMARTPAPSVARKDRLSCGVMAEIACYLPRLPDFDAVCCGFIFGAGGGATFAGLAKSAGDEFGLNPAGFFEKSGMPRGDFRFMGGLAGGSRK